jgi:hypothetical protein
MNIRPFRRGLSVSSPPATEETGAMSCEIKFSQGIRWRLFAKKNLRYTGVKSIFKQQDFC